MRTALSRGQRSVLLLIMLVALVACGAAPTRQTSPFPQSTPLPSANPSASPAGQQRTPVTDMTSLIAALQERGLTVEEAGTVSQPFFDVEGTTLRVEDADVQVFAFANEEAAQTAMATIGPDGNPSTMMITWVAPPHFYQARRLIVLYVGDDAAMTHALIEALGAQVAGQ